MTYLSKPFKPKRTMTAIVAALGLVASELAVAADGNGHWHYENMAFSSSHLPTILFSNDPSNLSGNTTTFSYSDFLKNNPDVHSSMIHALVVHRSQGDIGAVEENTITIDLSDADSTDLTGIRGIFVNGSSQDAKIKNNKITFQNDEMGESAANAFLHGINVQVIDSQLSVGSVKQQVANNTLTVNGGIYQSIRGFHFSGGSASDNVVSVKDTVISSNLNDDVFYGLMSDNITQFDSNKINLDNLTVTNKNNVVGLYLQTDIPVENTATPFTNNAMEIINSDIGGNVELAHGYLTSRDEQGINDFIYMATASHNELILVNSKIGGYVSVYAFFTNAERESKPVLDKGILRASGVNKVGGLAGYSQLIIDVNETNQSNHNAVITITGNNYSIQDNKSIWINDSANPNAVYYLLATSDESTLTFNNLTIGKESTFYRTTQSIDKLTIGSDQVLSWENGIVEVSDISEEPDNPGEKPENPDDQPDTPDVDDPVVTVTDNSKTLSESRLGTIAFVNQGAEFIADEGLAAMVDSATVGDISAFGAIHGGSSNYKTGSRVDLDGYTLATGAVVKFSPQWIVGGFIEAGWANSDSHVNAAKGNGDHDYYGIGLATRYMVTNAWYVDGSFRVGQASTEFSGLYAGDSANYDSDAFYVTAHAGTGYVFQLNNFVNLDVYGRYLITYLNGDDVTLHNTYGDKLNMNSTVTHALRLGGRLTGTFCPYAGWKIGLAYEHIFDGDAKSAVNGLNLEVPSLEGDTGIMEAGVTMKPSANSHWSMDVGVKGYAGDREGITGNLLVRYAF